MFKDVYNLRLFLDNLKRGDIVFKQYFYTKLKDRPYLNEDFIISSLKDINNVLGFQEQYINNETRYRIAIKLSGRYTLVVVVKVDDKTLYIITVWKTNRKWQKQIQK